MRHFLLLMSFVTLSLSAQNFQGVLTYKMEVVPHLSDEVKVQMKNPGGQKGDSIELTINNSNFVEKFKKSKNWVDSLRIVLGNSKIKKTYYKEKVLEYVFDLNTNKKYIHTPEYQCIDSVKVDFKESDNNLKWVRSDSVYKINGVECDKIIISKNNLLFIDLYVSKSDYSNASSGFVYETMNNLLFENLYPFKEELQNKWIQKLRYYTKYDQVDIIYTLQQTQALSNSNKEFVFPKYGYCYWDILDDKKLMKKHKKRMNKKKKNKG